MSSIQGKQWQRKPKKLNSYCDVQKYRALNITVTVRHFNGLVKNLCIFNKGYYPANSVWIHRLEFNTLR